MLRYFVSTIIIQPRTSRLYSSSSTSSIRALLFLMPSPPATSAPVVSPPSAPSPSSPIGCASTGAEMAALAGFSPPSVAASNAAAADDCSWFFFLRSFFSRLADFLAASDSVVYDRDSLVAVRTRNNIRTSCPNSPHAMPTLA